MLYIEGDVECESSGHNENTEEPRKILEGRKLYVAVDDDGDIDSVCCSKCNLRNCSDNNLKEATRVISGYLKPTDVKNNYKIDIEAEWDLEAATDN